ncbi:hypothetical protein TIFTF001_024529 [Ficus carica]|uniref:Dof zinc finger protein n=1 Tax=Ficus carica TaxID=3494 RepID=A0AA88ANI3_FICCA|nr:hypothetical protein TIFTF001_024529 [Ficus carica]
MKLASPCCSHTPCSLARTAPQPTPRPYQPHNSPCNCEPGLFTKIPPQFSILNSQFYSKIQNPKSKIRNPISHCSEMEKRRNPITEIAPSCPRCASSNTKFCYYNNYSLSQPRYFCKGCRRYWTKGGSLRNVPLGGGCRKSRRSKSSKLPHRERSSLSSYSHDSNESSNGGSGSQPGSAIDLAVIYANFLNQNTNQQVEPDSDGDQIVITPDSGISSNRCCAIAETDLIEGFSCWQDEKIELDMGNEIGEFRLESFLGDDQDVACSDPVNFSSKPISQLQEMETFPSMNLVNDLWSFFDSSGFDAFSTS